MTNNAPDYNDNLYFEKLQKKQNVANEKLQDLTEQLKKGKLPVGWYYVLKDGKIEMLEYSCDVFLDVDVPLDNNEITQVLAPVPSYEEWKEIVESEAKSHLQADSYYGKILDLKDLLKECKIYVENFIESSTLINNHHISYILLQRLNEVLK